MADDKDKTKTPTTPAAAGASTPASSSGSNEPANSADKSADQAKAQNDSALPGAAPAPPVEFDHGEKTEQAKADDEAADKVAKDPYGDTPLQRRDVHSPEVDPEKVAPTRGGTESPRSVISNAMEPGNAVEGDAEPVKGGTNAPA